MNARAPVMGRPSSSTADAGSASSEPPALEALAQVEDDVEAAVAQAGQPGLGIARELQDHGLAAEISEARRAPRPGRRARGAQVLLHLRDRVRDDRKPAGGGRRG